VEFDAFALNRRLVETLSFANDAKTFFIHLSLQEFAAARHARNLESPKFMDWIRKVRRKPSWKQVILLLAGLDDDSRTISALLDLDDPLKPVSCEGLLAAEALFEQVPPHLTVLPRFLESLATRFWSHIPLVSIEAAQQLACLVPFAKPAILRISGLEPANTPWSKLGSLLLRVSADDSKETVDDFKEWFKCHELVSVIPARIGQRDNSKVLPEEARDLQSLIIERGLERMIKSHDLKEISDYFEGLGELGNLPMNLLSTIQQRLIEIGLPETAKALWKSNFDTSWLAGMELAGRRSRKGEANLLRLIVLATGTTRKADSEPPFLVLSLLISALQYWESSAGTIATLEDFEPNEDEAGMEVIRALAAALKLDRILLGEEAQAALEFCDKHESNLYNAIALAAAEPDWSKLTHEHFNQKLIAQGLLHRLSLISLAAAHAIFAGFGRSEAAELIPTALDTDSEDVIWHAAAIAEKCLGHKAFGIFLSRLERPIYVAHKCLFREIARQCGQEHRQSAIDCFFSWLAVDNPKLATGVAEYLAEFDPPLGVEEVAELRRLLDHWTERGTTCETHGTLGKGGSCPQCFIVPPSPRAAILKELIRLDAIPFDELVLLCSDERHDVSVLARNIVVERAAANIEMFSVVLDRIETNRLSPRILDKLLKLPIQQGSPIAKKAERLLHATDLQIRLAAIGQLTGEWIDRAAAIKYLRSSLSDEEPTVRTLAARVLRLIEVT